MHDFKYVQCTYACINVDTQFITVYYTIVTQFCLCKLFSSEYTHYIAFQYTRINFASLIPNHLL